MNPVSLSSSRPLAPWRAAAWLPGLALLVAGLLLAAAPAQARTVGSGNLVTESRNVGEFQAVTQQGSIHIVIRQGDTTSVQVTADDNLLPLLETVVEDGREGPTLRVRFRRGERISTRSKLQVQLVTPRLVAVTSSGSGDIDVLGLQTPKLGVVVSGSSDIKLQDLKTDELEVRIAGSGDVQGNGRARTLGVRISGSGDVKMPEMRAEDVQISIAGSGDAAVHADKTLRVRIAGSGDVRYSGDAQVDSSVAGSGSVRKR